MKVKSDSYTNTKDTVKVTVIIYSSTCLKTRQH